MTKNGRLESLPHLRKRHRQETERSRITRAHAENRLSRGLNRRRCVSEIAFIARRTARSISDLVHAPLPSKCRGGICVLQSVCECCLKPSPLAASNARHDRFVPQADPSNVRLPSALLARTGLATSSPGSVNSRLVGVGTGVEPATARLSVWCSNL